ncbi:MAG: hypothetical protein KAR06_03080 [Deltaproteobacteria bacterium]|nr:hypothetical protein [Deltaproteobacteria bacterium]
MKKLTKKEAIQRINSAVKLLNTSKEEAACMLLGHSGIVGSCFGQITCGRCGEVIGDALTSTYDAGDKVLVGHKCETCVSNFKKMNWRDKLYTPDPFGEAH